MTNIFQNFLLTKENKKNQRKKKVHWLSNLSVEFTKAVEDWDENLQNELFGRISKELRYYFSSNIKVWNYDLIYPWYADEFFSELEFQLLRRLSNYDDKGKLVETRGNKMWNNGKNEWKEKKYNIGSLLISLSRYVHENVIYKFIDKSIPIKELRKQMKKWNLYTSQENCSGLMFTDFWNNQQISENLISGTTVNDVSKQIEYKTIYEVILKFVNNINPKTKLFKNISKDDFVKEIEENSFSKASKSILRQLHKNKEFSEELKLYLH